MQIPENSVKLGSVQQQRCRFGDPGDGVACEAPLRSRVALNATHFMRFLARLQGFSIKGAFDLGGNHPVFRHPVGLQGSQLLFVGLNCVLLHHLLKFGVRSYFCALQKEAGDHDNCQDGYGVNIHRAGSEAGQSQDESSIDGNTYPYKYEKSEKIAQK